MLVWIVVELNLEINILRALAKGMFIDESAIIVPGCQIRQKGNVHVVLVYRCLYFVRRTCVLMYVVLMSNAAALS